MYLGAESLKFTGIFLVDEMADGVHFCGFDGFVVGEGTETFFEEGEGVGVWFAETGFV